MTAASRRRLQAEQLERRFALAAVPTATVSGPSAATLIGEEIPLVVTFDNTAANPADIGYAPFVDIVMPATGDAPPTPNDGISFKPGTATYNGLSLQTTVLTFDPQGKATHPFAKNPDGSAVVVTGKPGDQLVVVQLPFGSYGPDQPAADIQFTGVVSPDAQPNHSYAVTATGGFRYQTDASGNPTVDVATLGTPTTDPIEPQLFRLTKTTNAPEAETATGPNFQHTYTVSMAVAPGQTVRDLLLEDVLPGAVQFVSLTAATGNGSTSITPVATPSTATPGGTLSRRFDQIIGTGSDTDVRMSFTYYVAQKDAGGADVIPLATGGTATITNASSASAKWTSTNPNFPGEQTVTSEPTDPATQVAITARTLALQKSFTRVGGGTSFKAGDTVEYTLAFQVSDFFALDDLVLTDVLSDGQAFDTTTTPTISFTQRAGSESYASQPFAAGNVTTSIEASGKQTVLFKVSDQLAALRNPGSPTDGTVLGAAIPAGGTTGPEPSRTPSPPGTTGTIVFRATVLDTYRVTPRPNADVVQGDVMTDTANLTSEVLAYADLAPTGETADDGSSRSFTLVSGTATKTVYAINGLTPAPGQRVTAGDAVTFQITYTLPFSSIKDYQLTDFLPLPIFAAQNLTFAGGGPSATAPGSGQWSFGPTDTFSQAPIGGPNPGTATANVAANSLTWNFGTYADTSDRSGKTDILFTVTASNRPFGDGLLLTNQARQSERNETDDLLTSNTALAQVTIAEPQLQITKGVVSTSNPSGLFTPTPVAPAGVTFSQPGAPGAAFTGTITSTGLASTPIDATLANVVGNDLVKFTIVVENTGSGPNGAFDVAIRDTFDATKFQIPSGGTGLNLRVTDGAGTTLAFTGTPTDLFGTGITLVDPAATTGSLAQGRTAGGSPNATGTNIAVISYDLQLKPSVIPLDVVPNTATVTNYAATEGGPNFVPGGISDDTTVTIRGPQVTKTLVGTSIVDAFNTNTQAVIGERVFYDVRIAVPQGTTPAAVLTDAFSDALGFVRVVGSPTVDPGVTVSGLAAIGTPTLAGNGTVATWNLGDIVNTNTDDQLHGLTFRVEAVVLNDRIVPQVIRTPVNRATLAWTGHTLPQVAADPVTVIEPRVTVAKSVSPTTAQARDTATFTIVVSASQTTAHNVSLADILPGGITYVAGSLAHTGGVAPTTLGTSAAGAAFTATWGQLTPGQTSTLTFRATVDGTVTSGQAITNTTSVEWTSLPGDPGQITPNSTNAYERTGSGSTTLGELNNYTSSSSATLTVAKPTVAKSLVSTSIVNAANSNVQAVIGELATYDVTVTIPQGRTPAAELIDRMNPGLAFVRQISAVNNAPAVLTVPGLNSAPVLSSSGTVATWNLGDIVNTDTNSATAETITFRIETVVLNVTSNTAGVTLSNRAQLYWSNRAGSSNNAQSGVVTVIEPKLKTTKSVAVGGLGGNPGDPVTYTIVIQQDPASQTDAFDATLTDVLPTQIAAPAIASVVDTAGTVTAADFQLAGGTLTTTTPFDLAKNPAGRTITLTITGTLQGPFTANQQISNTGFVRWTSLNGSPGQITTNNPNAFERTGSGSTSQGQLNNYVTSSTAALRVNTADLAVVKTVDKPTPNVGETVTFTVTVTNGGPNAATGVELTDTFPAGLQLNTAGITTSQGAYAPGTGIWTIGTLAPGATATLTLPAVVMAPPVNTIPPARTNVAQITAVVEPDPTPGNNRDDATVTPKYADLGVKKTTNNVTPNVNDTVTYTVSLFNLGTSAATGVEVTDQFPANVTFLSATPSAGTFNSATGVWSIPTVPLTATVTSPLTLTIQVRADSTETDFNTVTITKSDVWDPNNRNNTAKTPTIPQAADVVLSKTVDQPRPQVGADVVFTITVDNMGPSTAANVSVSDVLPAGLQFVSATASVGAYDDGTGVWTIGNMPASTTQTLDITATVLAAAVPSAANTATATSTTFDPNPLNNTDTAEVVPLQADLAVFKIVSDAAPNVGDTIEFTIAAHNFGPDDATAVFVDDLLPTGLLYVGHTATAGSYVPATGRWTIGGLAASDAALLVIQARVMPPSPAGIPPMETNTATISGREFDPDTTNNTDSVTETPQYADLAVTKHVSDAAPNVGDTITYTITVVNNGQDTATGVTLLDTLPTLAGLQITGTPQANFGTYDPGTGVWTIGTVNVGAAATLTIRARVLAPTAGNPPPQTNTAAIRTADQYDPDPTNDSDSVTETPQYADLQVTKTVNNPAPNVGAEVTFRIVVQNLGADQATNVTLDDVLPAGLTFVSASSLAYDPGTGVWTVGTVDVGPANAQTLDITAMVAASGSFTNTAAVSTTSPPDQYDPNRDNNQDTATVVTREADLALQKTVDDATPNVGDIITFTVFVTNNGPDIANNVEITDSFPTSGLQLISATPSQGSFNAGTGVWTVGTIDVGLAHRQTLTILARVLAPPVDTIPPSQTNVVRVTRVDEHDPDPLNNRAQVTETPQYADLAVTKRTSDVEPNVGDLVTYTVTLRNLGTATATNVEVTDELPDNVAVVSITPSSTHTAARFTETATGGVWSIPSIAPGDSEELVIVARATTASVAYNTATITHSDVWDPESDNNQARTPTDPQSADLNLTKTVDEARPEVNANVTFTLTLENFGPTAAQNVAVTDLLPAGLRFVSATPSRGSYDAGSGDWDLGTLAVGDVVTLLVTATVLPPPAGSGPVSPSENTATATSSTIDPNPGDNTDSSTVTPLQADLAVLKTASNLTPQIGSTFDYTIAVSNLGPDAAANAQVTDLLPVGVTYVSHQIVGAPAGSTYTPGTGIWDIGTVTLADRPELVITVRVTTGNSGGTVVNTASVTSGTWDPDLTNNESRRPVVVPPRGVIVGTDVGCPTGPFVRVIDPDTGADRIIPFFAYEPQFRGGVRVYGADVTGDGIPEIITAPGPGRPGQVRVFSDTGVPLPQYSFFPFGPAYNGGLEISAGSITAAGQIQIVAAQSRGGTVRVFDVTPAAARPVASTPIRQLLPFGPKYRGGVFVDTADIGTFSGTTRTSPAPDGITELVTGSGPGMRATVNVYNGVPASPVRLNSFNPFAAGFNRGVSVARLPSSVAGNADKLLVSSGSRGGSLVETYAGLGKTREAAFAAYAGSPADVFSAAIDETALFSVQGQLGSIKGVRKFRSTSGLAGATLPQSTVSYPPLRVAILRN